MPENIYLKRKIDTFLEEWKSDLDRLPLLVKGARQIGKTESILHFAYKHYKSVVYVSFVDEDYSDIINKGYHVDDIVSLLSLHNQYWSFIPGQTLIFFDEVQAFPEIMTSLKNFKIDGRYDVICSGSLLGINMYRINSVPVGYQTNYEMKSMDFEEFLWTQNMDIKDNLLNHMLLGTPLNQSELNKYNDLFKTYCVVGGMPQAVLSYVKSKNFSGVFSIHKDIVSLQKDDMAKYCEGLDVAKIKNTYNSIPVQLAKENKKFQWASINHNARFNSYFECIDWLEQVGLILKCYNIRNLELPLKGNYDERCYKVYLSDSGLLLSQLDEESSKDFLTHNNLGIYNGGLMENIVAEALSKSGKDLLYFRREKPTTVEEEFLLRTSDSIVPLEVKFGKGSSFSLRKLIDDNENYPLVKFGIKLQNGNIGYKDNIYTFPQFCAFLIGDFLDKKFD